MPVTLLYVEGRLDSELLGALFAGYPPVRIGGSKNSLASRVRNDREQGITACYVRDRDFDHHPPDDRAGPVADVTHQGQLLGWRWCRHEMENYLLEPALVGAALGWDELVYGGAVLEGGRRIRHYQIARWAVGMARRNVPLNYKLKTRPAELAEGFHLPADLTADATRYWAVQTVGTFWERIGQALGPTTFPAVFQTCAERFPETLLGSVPEVLVWCSGKDLFASLQPWLQGQHGLTPGALCDRVRNWVIDHPEETLARVPEWNRLVQTVRAYP